MDEAHAGMAFFVRPAPSDGSWGVIDGLHAETNGGDKSGCWDRKGSRNDSGFGSGEEGRLSCVSLLMLGQDVMTDRT